MLTLRLANRWREAWLGSAAVADVEVDPVASEEAHRMLGEPLTADAAVRVALLNNRELRATLRELGVARGRLMQAGVLPNPTVEVELQPERNSRFELRVEYDLTSAILAPRRARAAAPELTAARFHAAGAVVALGYHVRVAFYRVQASEQQLALAQRMLDTHAAGRDAARAMYAAGNVPELNVASMEVAYERARITVAELELAVATAREALHRAPVFDDAFAAVECRSAHVHLRGCLRCNVPRMVITVIRLSSHVKHYLCYRNQRAT